MIAEHTPWLMRCTRCDELWDPDDESSSCICGDRAFWQLSLDGGQNWKVQSTG